MADRQSQSGERLVEPLTRRELEILGLLARGLTGPEIARALTIALSSVRWHQKNLYGKLGVNSRRAALTQAHALGLLETTPPAGPALPPAGSAPRHNLPMELTRFFGREIEINQIKELLGEYRLVTVTGPGGVGKTRLALRVAEGMLDNFSDGVGLVELAALSDPALVSQETALALGVQGGTGGSIQDALNRFLQERQMLLVFDNCEHLVGACVRLAESLLRTCPRLTILATSREPLGSAGEAVFSAPSLPYPDPNSEHTLEALAAFPAVRLFVDRARMARPDIQITARDGASVARICQRVDGVPLAIEMAAARVNILTPSQLAGRLDAAFQVLTSGHATALPRQQTLRATINWSYSLLNAEERLLLQRLSVFAGGCLLETAEAVCADGALKLEHVLDLLASLVAKSMVIADHRQGGAVRYKLLEMVRQFAREELDLAGDIERLNARHRDFWLALAVKNFDRMVPTQERILWGKQYLADRENIRQMLVWSFGDEVTVNAVPFLAALLFSCRPRAPQIMLEPSRRALAWCENRAGVSNLAFARLVGINAHALVYADDYVVGVARLKWAIELSRQLGRDGYTLLALNLIYLGHSVLSQDQTEQASAAYAEAEELFKKLGPAGILPDEVWWFKANLANAKARLANKQGRYREAIQHSSELARLEEVSGQRLEEYGGQIDWGDAYLGLEEYDQARDHYLAAEQRLRQNQRDYVEPQFDIGSGGLARIYLCLGNVDLRQGNLDRARTYCVASVVEARKADFPGFIAGASLLAAAIWVKLGFPTRAATLGGAAQAFFAKFRRPPLQDPSLDAILPGWRDRPDQAAIAQAYAAGQAMDAEQAAAYVLSDAVVSSAKLDQEP